MCLLSILFCAISFAQNDGDTKKVEDNKQTVSVTKASEKARKKETKVLKEYDPLAPSRAAFYSAVLPGLGQAYNRKYWKIPVIYTALGAGIYFYIDNNKKYNSARDAYKRRLAGFSDDQFQGRLTDDGLRESQKTFKRNKELSLLITFGLYALNIIDANVDAHLLQYNINEDLSLKPHYNFEQFDSVEQIGLTLNFQF